MTQLAAFNSSSVTNVPLKTNADVEYNEIKKMMIEDHDKEKSELLSKIAAIM